MKRLFFVSGVVLLLAFLFLAVGTASAQDVLRLDVDKSYVINLDEGGKKTSYTDFLDTDQFEGNKLEFHIYVNKVEKTPILDEYVLKLETNLENPQWKFGDELRSSAEWIVWKGKEEHESAIPKVILSGEVPKPIKKVKDPGFPYDLDGIGKRHAYVKLTVGTTSDGATLETIIQKLEPSMEFFSTSEEIQSAKSTIDKNLEEARANIGEETDLERDIRDLYEEGHPGWASQLSEHYKAPVVAERQPLGLYIVLALILGLLLGSVCAYLYVSRGGGKGVDVSQISEDLDETSGRIDEKSSSINAISTRLSRSEDEEKRTVARELIRIRASLNEFSNEIREIADRIRGR